MFFIFFVPLHQLKQRRCETLFIIFYLYKNNNGVSIGVSKSHCCFYALCLKAFALSGRLADCRYTQGDALG